MPLSDLTSLGQVLWAICFPAEHWARFPKSLSTLQQNPRRSFVPKRAHISMKHPGLGLMLHPCLGLIADSDCTPWFLNWFVGRGFREFHIIFPSSQKRSASFWVVYWFACKELPVGWPVPSPRACELQLGLFCSCQEMPTISRIL